MSFKVGDKVYFGRTHGEKTLGEVVKVNGKTLKVKQLESRGTMRDYPIGTIWGVPHTLATLVSPSTAPAALPSWVKVGTPVTYTGEVWGKTITTKPVTGVITQVDGYEVEVYSANDMRNSKRVTVSDLTPAPKRSDGEIFAAFHAVHMKLEPEWLTADGERSRTEVARLKTILNRALKALATEFGRMVDDSEAWQRHSAAHPEVVPG